METFFPGKGILNIKLRQSPDYLILMIEIAILLIQNLYIESPTF